MKNDKYNEIILGDRYYTIDDLRYNQKSGFLFSKEQLKDFFAYRDKLIEEGCEHIERLPLRTFNSKYCFYVKGEYLVAAYLEYLNLIFEDAKQNSDFLSYRNLSEIMLSRVFSEVEGTLRIENVPTTHKRIKEIFADGKISDKNDIIVKNMLEAIRFIMEEKPEFNKENLYKLYNILSKDCLDEEDKLREGLYYRDDSVTVGGYDGAQPEEIEAMMDELFAFANSKESLNRHKTLLPHICHYYILYVHPYFDYNGRTARMVSFWLNYVLDIQGASFFISEAINENKNEYYRALVNSRNTNNDLTYFLGFILESSVKFSLIYKNMEEIKKKLAQEGEALSSAELIYVKKIIIHNTEDYFTCKMFFEYINSNMSRQGGLKILNRLVDYGILLRTQNKRKEAIFKINKEYITYSING